MKLNLGSGPVRPVDWVNVEWNPDYAFEGEAPCCFADFSRLPYRDESFAFAVSHHSLQQVEYVNLVTTIAEWRRVLVPGGVLRISVPDILAAFAAWSRNDADWFPIVDEAEPSLGGKIAAYLTWYSTARTLFTSGWLAELSARAGFPRTAVCAAGLTLLGEHGRSITALDTRGHESIYLEAQR